jgi:ABC-type transport system involved in multi-copper enzyme maturation permease subunit
MMYSRSDKLFMVAMMLLAILTGIGVGIVLSPSAPLVSPPGCWLRGP